MGYVLRNEEKYRLHREAEARRVGTPEERRLIRQLRNNRVQIAKARQQRLSDRQEAQMVEGETAMERIEEIFQTIKNLNPGDL